MRTATNDAERTCILTGAKGERAGFIRLALSPDGAILPDPGAKAPGRGAWLGVDAAALRAAQGSGKLKGALGRAFKGEAREVPGDLAGEIEAELERRTLALLGLEMKAGHLVLGFERLLSGVRAGTVRLILHAADAAGDGRRKLDGAGHGALQNGLAKPKSLVLPVDRGRLSMAVGQGNVVHAGISDPGAAARIEAAAMRWRAFCGLDGNDDAAEPRNAGPGRGDEGM